MDKEELIRSETTVDIASFSFNVGGIEEVGLAKIFIKVPYTNKPDAYSVTWSEWQKNVEGDRIQAKNEPQIQKVKKIQKIKTWQQAKDLFMDKITAHLGTYTDGSRKHLE